MGKKGYKGIVALNSKRFVVNDDGDHVLKLLERSDDSTEFAVHIIAGRVGEAGCEDAEKGCNALLHRPGRLVIDERRRIGYFTNRNSRRTSTGICSDTCVLRKIELYGYCRVTSLNLSLPSEVTSSEIAITKGLDFNRLLLNERGDAMVMCDRRTPLVLVVSNLLSPEPVGRLVYTGGSMPSPLQAAVWPSPSTFEYCYVGAADELWKVPLEGTAQPILRMTSTSSSSPFLCHELVSLPSSLGPLFLALNRHKSGTGLYLINTTARTCTYLTGNKWEAPHGMCLVPQEETSDIYELLIVETGQGWENNNKRGGRIKIVKFRVDTESGHVTTIGKEKAVNQRSSTHETATIFEMVRSSLFG